jgi:hypothetical protein
MERKGGDNINHSAHIWGSIYGLVFISIAAYSAGVDLAANFVESVKEYFRIKGWM